MQTAEAYTSGSVDGAVIVETGLILPKLKICIPCGPGIARLIPTEPMSPKDTN